MNTFQIKIEGENPTSIQLQVPSNWNELNIKQFEAAARYRLNFNVKEEVGQQHMLIELLGLKDNDLKEVMELLLDPNQEVSILDLYPYISWVNNDILLTDDKCYIPKGYVGIGEGYENIKFKQYYFIEFLYNQYRKDQTEANLEMLLPSIYLKGAFNEKYLESEALQFKMMETPIKQALLLNFIGQRNQFTEDYPLLFGKVQKEDEKIEKEEINFFDLYNDMLFDLPNDKFGDVALIENTPIRKIFNYCVKMKREALKTTNHGL